MMKLTKETILAAVSAGAMSISAVAKHLGAKGNVSGSTAKAIRGLVPDIAELFKTNKDITEVCKAVQVAAVKTVEAKAVKIVIATGAGKTKAVNPAKVSMKVIVFEYLRKPVILREGLTNAANDPRFVALCPKGEKLGDQHGGRYRRAYWQENMLHKTHAGSKGLTDIIAPEGEKRLKGHERLVQAVVLA